MKKVLFAAVVLMGMAACNSKAPEAADSVAATGQCEMKCQQGDSIAACCKAAKAEGDSAACCQKADSAKCCKAGEKTCPKAGETK